eukprot:3594940-Pleurochrysis_carterae.AAC.1
MDILINPTRCRPNTELPRDLRAAIVRPSQGKREAELRAHKRSLAELESHLRRRVGEVSARAPEHRRSPSRASSGFGQQLPTRVVRAVCVAGDQNLVGRSSCPP